MQPKRGDVLGSHLHFSLRGLNSERLQSDMDRIAANGFTLVVLWVNWGDIVKKIHWVDYTGLSKSIFERGELTERLHIIIEAADAAKPHRLQVMILPYTGYNPVLYSDAGETLSDRVHAWPYGIYSGPLQPAAPAPGTPMVTFSNEIIYWNWFQFLKEVSRLAMNHSNVYGFVIAWETGATAGGMSVQQVREMQSALKMYDPSKQVGFYPKPGDPHPDVTDFTVMGHYGDDAKAAVDAIKALSKLKIFVYETGTATNQVAFFEDAISVFEADPDILGYGIWVWQDNVCYSDGDPSAVGLLRCDDTERDALKRIRYLMTAGEG